MPPGYHPIKKNASKVPAFSTKRSPGWKKKFAATQREASALHQRNTPYEEDGSFGVKDGRVFDAETKRLRGPMTVTTGRHAKPRKIGGGDPVLGFLKDAADFVGGEVKKEAHPIREFKREAHAVGKIAKKVYKAADRYGDARMKEIIPDRGKSRKPIKLSEAKVNQLATGPRVLQAMQAGWFALKPRPGEFGGLNEIRDMMFGVDKTPGIKRYRMNAYKGDQGFHDRIPMITNKQHGRVNFGPFKETHGGLMRSVRGTEHLGRDDFDKWYQGSIYRPESTAHRGTDPIQFDLGFGKYSGEEFVAPQSHMYRALMHLLRNYDDESVMFKQSTPYLANAVTRQGPERVAELMAKMGIKDEKDMDRWLRDFSQKELKRKRGR